MERFFYISGAEHFECPGVIVVDHSWREVIGIFLRLTTMTIWSQRTIIMAAVCTVEDTGPAGADTPIAITTTEHFILFLC